MSTYDLPQHDADSKNVDDGDLFLNEEAYQDTPTLKTSWLLFFVLLLGAGFFLVDHSFNASTYFRKVHALELDANRTADRIETVNLASTPMRLVLGLAGLW